ncbi:hypothetical protein [Mesorhizobium sp. P5_C1]
MNSRPAQNFNCAGGVTEDFVSVSNSTYHFPHAIRDSSKVARGQEIELIGEVTRIDEDSLTIDLRSLVRVKTDKVRFGREMPGSGPQEAAARHRRLAFLREPAPR